MLLEAARDSSGQIVDFLYREVNQATCDYLGLSREDLIGRGVVETMPGIKDTLLPSYVRCLGTGQPLILDDFSYDNEVLADTRRYDLRATRATPTSIALTWRDVTERFVIMQRIASSERQYRLMAENMGDFVAHVRDGRIVWASPSVKGVLGATPDYWIGREVREVIPAEDLTTFAANMSALLAGENVRERARVVTVDGVTRWIHLNASPFYDADGRQDGLVASLRLLDDEVAAEQDAEEARRQQARADERYRRTMDNAAIGMCLIDPEGHFEEVNEALCQLFGYDAETLKQMTWQELTAPDYLEADLKNVNDVLEGRIDSYRMIKQYIHADGHPIWGDLAVSCLRDERGQVENFISQITDMTDEFEARDRLGEAHRHQARADERYRRSMNNAAVGMCLCTPEGRFEEVNDAMRDFYGYDIETLTQMSWQELTAPDYLDADLEKANDVLEGRIDSYRMVKQFIHADGHPIWGDLSVSSLRDEHGRVENFIALITDVTAEVEADERNRILAQQLQQQTELIKQQARAGERFRRSMDNAAVAMCLVTPEGRFKEVNDAACQFFGLGAQTLKEMSFQDVTPQEYLDVEMNNYNDLLEGRIDSYRMVKHYVRGDGQVIWGDITVSCIRDENGRVSEIVGQIINVTAEVEARQQLADQNERNRLLAERLQLETDRMTSELNSAATYMASIMPRGLEGPVTVSSRYLPSRELGGDSFDYTWIDEDHLLVYLIDVSGHGLEPALLSVSLHNMLRSGSLTEETLLAPEAVLAELNRRFQMDKQSYHYFTMWYGVYEASTRTLRYTSAGAPPALAFTSAAGTAVAVTELSTTSAPVGMFEDTEFTSHTYQVPPGCRMLIYSDGASEITLADGRQLAGAAFIDVTSRVAVSPDWSLDDLIYELRALTPSGAFEDDCSLIQVQFD